MRTTSCIFPATIPAVTKMTVAALSPFSLKYSVSLVATAPSPHGCSSAKLPSMGNCSVLPTGKFRSDKSVDWPFATHMIGMFSLPLDMGLEMSAKRCASSWSSACETLSAVLSEWRVYNHTWIGYWFKSPMRSSRKNP